MPLASQAELKRLEDSVYDAVRARPFRKIDGKAEWGVVVEWEEYSHDIAIVHQPSYGFAEKYGLVFLTMTGVEYHTETGAEPEFDYPEMADLMLEGYEDMDEDTLRLAERTLDERNKDYVMCEGFSRGYGEIF